MPPKKMKTQKSDATATGSPARRARSLADFLKRVSLADKIFFTENLRVMLKAGLPLSRAFQILALQTENQYFRTVISEIGGLVDRGESLTDSLVRFPKIFSPIMVNMVRVGEVSGTLERSLEVIATQMKKEATLRSKIRGALAYPVVVIAATFGIGIAMMVFVIPKVLSIFNEVNIDLPITTRILIAVANIVSEHGIAAALASLGFIIAFILFRRTTKGKHLLQALYLKLPIAGAIIKKVNLARFTRTLASLLKSEVPVIDACMVTANVLGNVHFQEAVQSAAERVKRGVSVAEALAASPLFPPLVTQMASVGEQSGSLDELLADLAVFYEEQVDETLGNFSQIIEPLLIIVLGGAVGLMAFAIISPIYTLAENIG